MGKRLCQRRAQPATRRLCLADSKRPGHHPASNAKLLIRCLRDDESVSVTSRIVEVVRSAYLFFIEKGSLFV
jgi:hypothetical protein